MLRLRLLAGTLTVHRFGADAALPAAVADARPLFLVRSDEELSVVCSAAFDLDSERRSTGWRCLAVDGPLDFDLTGVAAALTGCLAAAGVSVLPMASYDTDFLLLLERDIDTACSALCAAGYELVD